MSTAQLNIRINPSLKAAGDLAFGRLGWSPSIAIRKLYELARDHAYEPNVIEAALAGKVTLDTELPDESTRRRVEMITNYAQIIPRMMPSLASLPADALPQESDEDLLVHELMARYELNELFCGTDGE